MTCLIEDYKLAFQNCMFCKVKRHALIKACNMFGILDDERHFFKKRKKEEKVMHDKMYEILRRSIYPKVEEHVRRLISPHEI